MAERGACEREGRRRVGAMVRLAAQGGPRNGHSDWARRLRVRNGGVSSALSTARGRQKAQEEEEPEEGIILSHLCVLVVSRYQFCVQIRRDDSLMTH